MKKFLFDLFPLLLFFVAYRFADIYVATGVAMVAAVGQIAYIKLTGQKIEAMHWINLVVIVVFGGATLWLQNEAFIKWKPTVLYWLFGGICWAVNGCLAKTSCKSCWQARLIWLTPAGAALTGVGPGSFFSLAP